MFEYVFSIGYGCIPAYQIKRWIPHSQPQFFDNLNVPYPALISMWTNGLVETLFDETQFVRTGAYLQNAALQVTFTQELINEKTFDKEYDNILAAYMAMEQKWNKAMNSGGLVCLIRHHILQDECVTLLNAINNLYPNADCHILAMNERDPAEDWDIPKIYNGYVAPNSGIWHGNDDSWQHEFRKFKVI